MIGQDSPMLLWYNLLAGQPYTVTAGTEEAGRPISNVANLDTLRPAQIAADATGTATITWTLAPGIGYGTMPFGFGPWGGQWPIEAIVLGANRHQSAGFRTTGLTWSIAGETIIDIWPTNSAVVIIPPTPFVGTTMTLTITGAAAGQLITIPELYVGPAITMPYLDLGYDPYHEVANAGAFRTESGREYLALRYRRLELSPSWSVVPSSLWAMLDGFRENVLEQRKALWWAWAPASHPTEVYLVRHSQPSATMPIKTAVHRSMRLKLVEAV